MYNEFINIFDNASNFMQIMNDKEENPNLYVSNESPFWNFCHVDSKSNVSKYIILWHQDLALVVIISLRK